MLVQPAGCLEVWFNSGETLCNKITTTFPAVLSCIEISLLQCYYDRFPSSVSPTKVLSLIRTVFSLGRTIICLLAGCVCVCVCLRLHIENTGLIAAFG
jgi:hypothetical protein